MNKIFALPALLLTITACTNPEKRVHQLLTERMETLAVAESCTGGSIAARLMATPGASAYFKGGVVAYWNQTKESLLGIPRDTIALYGVVSEEIVRMMAESVRNVTDTHYGIATTAAGIIKCILHDENRIIPVSTLLEGEYGERGVFCGVPAVIGRGGIQEIVQLPLTGAEEEKFHASCEVLRGFVKDL